MHLDGAFAQKAFKLYCTFYQFMHPLSNWTHDLDIASEMLPFEEWITYHSNFDEISCSGQALL